jgi:hypothetical protein
MARTSALLVALAASSLSHGGEIAQPSQMPMPGGSPGSMDPINMGALKGMKSPSMMAMHDHMASMKKMNRAMMAANGPTADTAFARKMTATTRAQSAWQRPN